jgi:hypothetical protein
VGSQSFAVICVIRNHPCHQISPFFWSRELLAPIALFRKTKMCGWFRGMEMNIQEFPGLCEGLVGEDAKPGSHRASF